MPPKDYTGQKFGRLIALSLARTGRNNIAHWRCRCECGNERVVELPQLIAGKVAQCTACAQAKLRETRRSISSQFKIN